MPVEAGILVGGTNVHGLIQGTDNLNGSSNPTLGTVVADVDWSVFAPGSGFQSFLSDNGLSLSESFSGSNYTYVYQLTNINSQSAEVKIGEIVITPAAPVDLLQMTLQIDNGDIVVGAAPGSLSTDPNDVLPLETTFAGTTPASVTSAVWNFFQGSTTDPIPNGDQSGLLYFASPQPPEFASITALTGGGFSIEDDPDNGGTGVPSPGVPEPSTLLLVLAGGAIGLTQRRVR